MIIGGAALNAEVEAFFTRWSSLYGGLRDDGMCPAISYDHHYNFVPTSCGSVLEGIMEARIDSTDPENIPGEIQVRGENVMKGYYKNPSNRRRFYKGWLVKDGRLGVMKGRRFLLKDASKPCFYLPMARIFIRGDWVKVEQLAIYFRKFGGVTGNRWWHWFIRYSRSYLW